MRPALAPWAGRILDEAGSLRVPEGHRAGAAGGGRSGHGGRGVRHDRGAGCRTAGRGCMERRHGCSQAGVGGRCAAELWPPGRACSPQGASAGQKSCQQARVETRPSLTRLLTAGRIANRPGILPTGASRRGREGEPLLGSYREGGRPEALLLGPGVRRTCGYPRHASRILRRRKVRYGGGGGGMPAAMPARRGAAHRTPRLHSRRQRLHSRRPLLLMPMPRTAASPRARPTRPTAYSALRTRRSWSGSRAGRPADRG